VQRRPLLGVTSVDVSAAVYQQLQQLMQVVNATLSCNIPIIIIIIIIIIVVDIRTRRVVIKIELLFCLWLYALSRKQHSSPTKVNLHSRNFATIR